MSGIRQVQTFGGDSFGFGERLHLKDPKLFKKYEMNWNQFFNKAKIIVNVEVKINDDGQYTKKYSK